MKLSEELVERGFVHQYSTESLSEILDGQKRVIYHGIDPTADSAHAGNFVNWMLLKHLADAGHKIIFLVGGGTGMIGDPKPDIERQLTDPSVVANNVSKIKAQAEKLLGSHEIVFVNNNDWLSQVNLITFLRDIGKHFSVNELIKKDAIATRLAGENGLSYTEFAYPLLQAFDYLQLNRQYNCDLQVGGSDQWGNIVAGVDLVRRVEKKNVYALTVPLIVDKVTGKKFGKSEGNAVWLSAEKTSPYNFYQFWFNTADENVIDYLKLYTTLELEDIKEMELEFEKNPGQRGAQKCLAFEITKMVHGEESALATEKVSACLFGEVPINQLSEAETEILLANAPRVELKGDTVLTEALILSGLATSKREARTFIESGAVYVQGEKQADADFVCTKEGLGKLVHLRRGKKQITLLKFTS